jgi:hypothetical protein
LLQFEDEGGEFREGHLGDLNFGHLILQFSTLRNCCVQERLYCVMSFLYTVHL